MKQPGSSPRAAAADLTANRQETKYLLPATLAASFVAEISAHIPLHRFRGQGANPLPRARSYVTTVYFDTAARALYQAVKLSEDNLKVRAREYYDLHPELIELATRPEQLVRYRPVLWIELKAKEHGRTLKKRVGIPKPQVQAFFERGAVSREMRELQGGGGGGGGGEDDVIAELLAIRARFAQPLSPSCLVNYRRTAYQDDGAGLRITLDQRLACFAPSQDLLQREQPLVRESLGAPAYEEASCVLEIKTVAGSPEWLSAALERCGASPSAYSKFVTASEAVARAQK